uniref:ZZ-type domain-containing protein n=1 Tax=Sparus aurata TaxID=8175 RepID=A0A671YXD2_SPAAU
MDLDSIEGLNEIRPSVYRVAMKLLSLQKLCHSEPPICRPLSKTAGRAAKRTGKLAEVTRTLNRMFHSVSQEVPGHVTVEAPEETSRLIFRLYDRSDQPVSVSAGSVSAGSLQTALIALSADTLLVKYRALVSVAENSSGSVSRSGLRSLLQDLSQVPAAVQEEGIFGAVEPAVRSCFNGVLTPTAGEQHVLSWLQSEPHLLLWLPTLYRLSVSRSVSHSVRCHTCKTFPITGLRYRCMKCVNIHVCQSCFLTERQTRKHKTHHPVLEFCTQPTWRETLSSLVHSARHAVLPRRYAQIEAERGRVLMWAEAPPPSHPSARLAASTVSHSPSSDRDVSHDASVLSPPCSSKALQTDEETQPPQAAALITEVRNLQRDKWLLEQQLQAWRLTVQSEQGILEDRCSEMEVAMETLKEHNLLNVNLSLLQALNKMEAQQLTNNTPRSADDNVPRSDDDNVPRSDDDNVPRSADDNVPRSDDDNAPRSDDDNAPRSDDDNAPRSDDDNVPRSADTQRHVTFMSDTDDEEEEGEEEEIVLLRTEDECNEEKHQTPSPTMHLDTPPSHDILCEEEEDPAGNRLVCHPTGKQDGAEEAGTEVEDTCLSKGEEDYGICSPEELLQETVDRLKTGLETDRWKEMQTCESYID